MKLIALVLAALLPGCASDRFAQDAGRPGLPPLTIGMWPNPYAGDRNLAAVAVIQGPTNPFDQWGFAHRQPTAIWYAFWDGRVRQVDYRGDGSVQDSFWWSRKAWLKAGSAAWAGFDFNCGSDPTFARHRDPRLPDTPPPPASAGR